MVKTDKIIILICVLVILMTIMYEKFKRNQKLNRVGNGKIMKYLNYLVIVAHYKEDINWLNNIIYPNIVYEKLKLDNQYFCPNVANEASSYLKFICDYYDQLPKNVIFLHGEEEAWHHDGKLSQVIEKHVNNYEKNGYKYYNLDKITMNNFKINKGKQLIQKSQWWIDTMQDYFGEMEQYGSWMAGKKCCAQFIVSREQIRKLPKKFYCNMYNWLINNSKKYDGSPKRSDKTLADPLSSYNTGRYLEWSWELIFTY